MSRWVVVVVSDESNAQAYGAWKKHEKAAAFARKLIDKGLDAQVRAIERPTLKQVQEFFIFEDDL